MPGKYVTGYKQQNAQPEPSVNRGTWNSGSYYYPGEYVTYNFTTYTNIAAVTLLPPQTPDAATWAWQPGLISVYLSKDIGSADFNLVEKSFFIENYAGLLPAYYSGGRYAWGRNQYGQLGLGDYTDRSSPVLYITSAGRDYLQWRSISAGGLHSAGAASLYEFSRDNINAQQTWGYNDVGQLGVFDINTRSLPIIVTNMGNYNNYSIIAGYDSTYAISSNGYLYSWGNNNYGQLGNGTVTNASGPQLINSDGSWKQISAGLHFAAAVKTDGSLWTWGLNSSGQLGTNDINNRSSPVQTVTGGNNWKQVSTGQYHTSAIKTDGTLWVWGYNYFGQLGTNDIVSRSSPVQTVAGGTNWKYVNNGSLSEHTAAIKTDGSLWVWGRNFSGQLGTNDTTDRSSPVQTVSSGKNWIRVSCGLRHTVAIKGDGSLWTWGNNSAGALGDSTIVSKSSPIQVTIPGVNRWRSISAGQDYTLAINELNGIY